MADIPVIFQAQGSAEWQRERAGHATASRIADIVAKNKTGWGASRHNYAAQLVAERLTGQPAESYSNAAMQWGTEHEPAAAAEYECVTGGILTQCGYLPHPSIPNSGASPDRLVGEDGLVEIKCPSTATHIETLLVGEIERKYLYQMHWQMRCADRRWCDFVSFDPRMPEAMRLYIKRVERDDKLLAELEDEVRKFLAEVDATVAELSARYLKEAA